MIGIKTPSKVDELFQLLKVPWEYYNPEHKYDAIITDEQIHNIPSGKNLIELDCNSLSMLMDILNQQLVFLSVPHVDYLMHSLRQRLKEKTTLVEIPPVPWGYSHMVALTHDVDITSVRERPISSVMYAICQCIIKFQFISATRILLAKIGLVEDPWNTFKKWMKLEDEIGVRSTFFFIPFPGDAGDAPPSRASHYTPDMKVIKRLTDNGWEVGVHGVNNYKDDESARRELQAIPGAVGTRVHWLLFNKRMSWKILDSVGYKYDSTIGHDERVGTRAGTYQVYMPQGVNELLELPPIIQDIAMFGKKCWKPVDKWRKIPCMNLSEEEAKETCDHIFSDVIKYGGVVTISWHSDSITPPRKWDEFYINMVKERIERGAWVARAIDIVNWFWIRRQVKISTEKVGNIIRIQLDDMMIRSPFMRVRVHIDPNEMMRIERGDGDECCYIYDYENRNVDIKADTNVIKIHLRKTR